MESCDFYLWRYFHMLYRDNTIHFVIKKHKEYEWKWQEHEQEWRRLVWKYSSDLVNFMTIYCVEVSHSERKRQKWKDKVIFHNIILKITQNPQFTAITDRWVIKVLFFIFNDALSNARELGGIN
jgi:hypothetical protein